MNGLGIRVERGQREMVENGQRVAGGSYASISWGRFVIWLWLGRYK